MNMKRQTHFISLLYTFELLSNVVSLTSIKHLILTFITFHYPQHLMNKNKTIIIYFKFR